MNGHKKIIITGASGGIGSALSEYLLEDGYPLILACRNLEKAKSLKIRLLSKFPKAEIEYVPLQLDSIASILQFCELMKEESIGALVNNAGLLAEKYALSEDGFEKDFAVNCLAPSLLSMLLAPQLGEKGSIVNVVSCTCSLVNLKSDYLQSIRRKERTSFNRLKVYAHSKLALYLMSLVLSEKMECRVAMADPGVVSSSMIHMNKWFDPLADIFFRPFIKSCRQGALPLYRALKDEEAFGEGPFLYQSKHLKKEIHRDQFDAQLMRDLYQFILDLYKNCVAKRPIN